MRRSEDANDCFRSSGIESFKPAVGKECGNLTRRPDRPAWSGAPADRVNQLFQN
jgi:hypothetical protein